jgi:hypothetical protein
MLARRRDIGPFHEKIWGKVEKPCFAHKLRNRLLTGTTQRTHVLLSLEWSGTVLTSFGQRSRLVTTLQIGHRSRPAFREALGKYTDALREAFAACREYHHLTSKRIPDEKALRKVFGLDEVRE